jgi:hypothetical protein
LGILGQIEHRVVVRQRVYASSEEVGAADPVLGVFGGSGECARVHVGAHLKKELKRAMEMRRVREELKWKKKKDLETMRKEREIRV